MRVLHLCNNFVLSKVHNRLIRSLKFYCFQTVLVPCRKKDHINSNNIDEPNIFLSYLIFNNSILKFFPLFKIFYIFLICFKSVKSKSFDFGVAHTLWSDGFVLYLLSRIMGFKYVVMVRNTDINVFVPKLLHYRFIFKLVIKNSDAVIFISEAHRKRFVNDYPSLYHSARVVKVIPNGIDDFWLNNVVNDKSKFVDYEKLIFVGKFDKNKNLKGVVEACKLAKATRFFDLKLVCVGGSKKDFCYLVGLDSIPDWIEVKEHCNSNAELLELYRSASVFVMPSFTETFGLVYFEALSQGCSIIGSKGEGPDGFINGSFARFVNPHNVDEIAQEIISLLNNFPNGLEYNSVNAVVQKLSWSRIAAEYIQILDKT